MLTVNYVTSSRFKTQENKAYRAVGRLIDGRPVQEHFDFNLVSVAIKEILEVDLSVMVSAEVVQAYSMLKVPCIVEHAGLILDRYGARGYPGGLTKPMWDTLGPNFLEETRWAGQPARARAVVAYCDGKSVQTFTGETPGRLADQPRGDREFYWDTIFVPNEVAGVSNDLTYAELVATSGLEAKMDGVSQSARAMTSFLEYLSTHPPALWR